MRIYGQFKNINNESISVEIINSTLQDEDIEIGGENLYFSGDPIHIEMNNDDTFEHIIKKTATINLITNKYVGDYFFAQNSRSVSVEINKGNECLFYGFVEPNTFSQSFTNPLDDFTINCVDFLSTLQYYNYKNATIETYDALKRTANNIDFKSILDNMFQDILPSAKIFYDNSKGLTEQTTQNIFSQIGVTENVFYDEDFEDIWTYDDTLNEMLKYLNMHIVQEGKDFYIFDWNTLKNGRTQWVNLETNSIISKAVTRVNLLSSMHSDNNTTISISDVYSQIQVKDDLEGQETIIESPLQKEKLTSLWRGKQLYMTEYISEGSGDKAHDAMVNIINGNTTTYDAAKQYDWYIQAMTNPNWKFYYDGENTLETLAETEDGKFINQWKMARFLKQNSCVPYIFKFGSVEKNFDGKDNSPVSKITMTPYLYISINGNENDTENDQYPNDTTIHSHAPMIEYVAQNSGGAFSPNDDETTNYLVFSGQILLQPIVYESSSTEAKRTNNFQDIKDNGLIKTEDNSALVPFYDGIPLWSNNLVKSDNNEEGRYYTRKFYTQKYPNIEEYNYLQDGTCGIQPWTKDKSARGYQFKYSQKGDGTDKWTKLPILECELIIGNKRLIETDADAFGKSNFKWVTLGQEPTTTYDGTTYPITTFSLGINPKIDDYIIGDEFDIQNNISYTMNIDAEGTAIPITKDNALSGPVLFRILGPVNTMWNDISRRHPTWFRHTKWTEKWHFILSHVENIIVKDFECKVYSNSGGFEVSKDKDLIYMSDESQDYISKKENVTFKLITQLSGAEAYEKGISSGVNLNAVIDLTSNLPLSNLYNATTNETAKPEEHYVDQYYTSYCQPKIIMETQLHNAPNVNFFNTFRSNTLLKNFFVQSMSLDVRMNNITLTLKEI